MAIKNSWWKAFFVKVNSDPVQDNYSDDSIIEVVAEALDKAYRDMGLEFNTIVEVNPTYRTVLSAAGIDPSRLYEVAWDEEGGIDHILRVDYPDEDYLISNFGEEDEGGEVYVSMVPDQFDISIEDETKSILEVLREANKITEALNRSRMRTTNRRSAILRK